MQASTHMKLCLFPGFRNQLSVTSCSGALLVCLCGELAHRCRVKALLVDSLWFGSSRCAAAVAQLVLAAYQESRRLLRVCADAHLAGVSGVKGQHTV